MSTFAKCFCGYLAMTMLTAGWVASDPCPYAKWTEQKCGSREDAWFEGYMSGIVWPFYWTTHLFMLVRPASTPQER